MCFSYYSSSANLSYVGIFGFHSRHNYCIGHFKNSSSLIWPKQRLQSSVVLGINAESELIFSLYNFRFMTVVASNFCLLKSSNVLSGTIQLVLICLSLKKAASIRVHEYAVYC